MLASQLSPEVEQDLLSTEVLGLRLNNPVVVAAGPLTDSRRQIEHLLDLGAGAVVTKTIYAGSPSGEHEKVRFIETGLINSTTYSRRPLQDWLAWLRIFAERDSPVIASVHARTADELSRLCEAVAGTGCRALELGIACPNDGWQQRLTPEIIYAYTAAARTASGLPLSVKLTAADSYVEQAHAALGAGASAISISDSLPSVRVNVDTGSIMLGGAVGYSGAGILPIALYSIFRLRSAGVSCPIIGIGGACGSRDILEYLQIGASAVQLYTALLRNEHKIELITSELSSWCRSRRLRVSDIVGAALESSGQ